MIRALIFRNDKTDKTALKTHKINSKMNINLILINFIKILFINNLIKIN